MIREKFSGVLPPETFRVRPWKDSRLWILVHVADTLPKMRHAMKRFCGDVHPTQVAGVIGCIPVDAAAKRAFPGLAGLMFFSRTHLGGSLVAHEISHAAFRICDRRRMRVQHWKPSRRRFSQQKMWMSASNEEKYCHYVEHMTHDFWREAYGRRLVP